MIQILKIQYKDNHISVDLNNGEKLMISYKIISQYKLEKDKNIDNTEYLQLKAESDRFTCKQKALSYLAIRNRSTLEMNTYLKKKGFSSDIINETIINLKNADYLNDYDFAVKFVSDKVKRKPVGKNLLKRDLYHKGISRETSNRALKESGALEVDFDRVYDMAQKKYNSLANKSNKTKKLIYFLQQKGFEYDLIKKIVNKLKEDNEIDDAIE